MRLVEEGAMREKQDKQTSSKPSEFVNEDEQRDFPDEKKLLDHDEEFVEGTYIGGLVKGTRRIETSEVRPDKGM